MAIEKRGTITITAKADTSQLESMNDSLSRMEGLLGKVGSSLSSIALNQATQLFGTLKSTISEGISEMKAFNTQLNIFKGDIGELRTATKGVVTDLELMGISNRLATLGVKMTNTELGQMLQDLKKVSAAMGRDFKDALNDVSTMLGRSSILIADNIGLILSQEKANEAYAASIGKTVKQLTEQEKKLAFQAQALQQMKEKAAQLPEAVDTASMSLGKLWTTVKNLTTATAAFVDRWAGMQLALRGQLERPDLVAAGAAKSEAQIKADVDRQFGASELLGSQPGMSGLGDDYDYSATGARARLTGKGGGPSDPRMGGLYGVHTYDKGGRPGFRGGKKGGPRKATGPGFWGTFEDEFRQVHEGQGDFWGSMSGDYDSQWSASERYGKSLQRGQAEQIEKVVRAAEQEADANKKRYAAWKDVNDITAKADKQMKDMAVGGLASFAGGLWAAADAAIQGGESIGAALSKMLKSTLLSIAQQATVQAVFELAQGFAALALTFGIPNPKSTAHFAAAGLFGATAAVAGTAGLALSAAGVGASSGGSGSGAASSAAGGGGYRPQFGSESRKKEQPIIVKVVFDRSDPAAESFARRQVRAQLEAA